ncbi:MAG: helix-turn-helix transcriptional regulator [Clostridia bacterium]|nr:helix-turn-helix transcriptional regulator [Clostridia bacterium]
MQLNLGTKIRELRRRDGRTQDALAEALGVTAQAVSRWESGGSYPDMEMIPAIANYFHISIDELFGYHDDREEKIHRILYTVDKVLTKYSHMHQGSLSKDVTECIHILRNAAEEFPNEPKILLKLAQSLHMWGWNTYGARGRTDDASGMIEYDVEYNAQNIYWQEAIRIYEKLLKSNPSPEDREIALCQLTPLYCRVGEYEKAKALANEQNSLIICKELLLPMATTGEEKARYQCERMMALLSNLQFAISESIAYRPAVSSSEYGSRVLLSVIHLYETIFDDGKFGDWHKNIARLYLVLTGYEINKKGAMQIVLAYFDKAFEHYKESTRIYNEGNYSYSAPLVSNLKPIEQGAFAPADLGDFWKTELKNYPKEILDVLQKNPKYSVCFA